MTTLLAILVLGCMALVFGAILGFASVKFHVEGILLPNKLTLYYRKHNVVNVVILVVNLMQKQ
jgi:hypothetical protein